LLDGGLQAWQQAGMAVSDGTAGQVADKGRTSMDRAFTDPPITDPSVESVATGLAAASFDFNHQLCLDVATLLDKLAAQQIRLIDARAEARFNGQHEPIDPVAGHVPGALNMPFQQNLGDDGLFLSAAELAARFAFLVGHEPVDHEPVDHELVDRESETSDVIPAAGNVVHMCGSGVTACHNLLAMEIAGLKGSRLYVGSWSEWIRDPERAVITGS
jgi:thiosulfate/3-mercaptopyruvate sulfurtransferase